MAFINLVDFCLQKNSNDEYEVIVTDTTDVYDVADNPTGWEDAATILAANVTEATITIEYKDSSGNIVSTTTNVLDQIPDPVIGQIEFDPFVFNGDGRYKITYVVKTVSTTYTACKQKILYPEVACCISNKISKLAANLTNTTLIDQITKLKAFQEVLEHSCSTIDETTALNVLNSLEKLCAKDCGCGC